MADPMQKIEDYYVSQGLKGEELRAALENDTRYQTLLKERKALIKNKFSITDQEEKDYLLPNEEDYEILSKVKFLEGKELTDHDKEILSLIKTQLKDDWRSPILDKLNEILQKYS